MIFRQNVLVDSFAFGRGEDEAPLMDRRFSFGGGVLDPVGEAPVTEIPGPPLVFGLNGEVNAWLKLRLLPVAVDGRSVIVEVVVGYGYPGKNSIPCRNISTIDYSNKFTIIYYLSRCSRINNSERIPWKGN